MTPSPAYNENYYFNSTVTEFVLVGISIEQLVEYEYLTFQMTSHPLPRPLLVRRLHCRTSAMSIAILQVSTTCQYLLQSHKLVKLRLGFKFLLHACQSATIATNTSTPSPNIVPSLKLLLSAGWACTGISIVVAHTTRIVHSG